VTSASLKDAHLSRLHELAAELGIDRFRMLSRAELIDRIDEAGGGGGDEEPGESASADSDERNGGRRPRRRRRGRERSGARERDSEKDAAEDFDEGPEGDEEADADRRDAEAEAGEPVSGLLDITPRGHGFIRLSGFEPAEGDVYVSPSQIRRCELERGDLVAGPARQPRRGERHPALIHVDAVNGAEPSAERTPFEALTPVPPSSRIELDPAPAGGEDERTLLRAVDLLAPLARGQRVLVRAARGSGRTTLLRALARSLAADGELELVVLLVDERPEEEPRWREALPDAALAIATGEMRSDEQLRLVELAFAHATRKAEAGADVVLLIDSLSRIAVAEDDPSRVKPLFGAGRATEAAGSLTVVATALVDDGEVLRAVETTENATVALDPELAAEGVFPALEVGATRTSGEEELRGAEELAGARALRAELAGLPARDAAERLRERMAAEQTNASLLVKLAG
jgi:transcription termination factor Rho